MKVTVNGAVHHADVEPGESLLHLLRERLGLTGTKNACEQGECGSCVVLLDDVPVCACLVLAGQADGMTVTTIEGVAGPQGLHPVQQAFVDAGAIQCGFCTPGLVLATIDLLRHTPAPTDDDVREALAGNLCRCTGYQQVIEAVRLAARRSA
ncbi:MAG TPA: (2Fe-2S)-binding protein [Acidimicrobiales bacterium]|nr:(2Fe-2S)-binding protein [Acidimicrobiales bacterium]